jgi:hypothetical protein
MGYEINGYVLFGCITEVLKIEESFFNIFYLLGKEDLST